MRVSITNSLITFLSLIYRLGQCQGLVGCVHCFSMCGVAFFPFVKSTLPSHIIWWVRFDTESAHTLQRLIQPLYIATTRMTRIVLQRQLPHWPMMHLRGMRVDNCSKPTSCSITSRLMMPIICWAKESFWVLLYPSIIISSRPTTCKVVTCLM